MNRLKLEQLSIRTLTEDGTYGVDIPFEEGLNIISAENTSGKTTCIQSIIYALGLEGCLGPSRKVPLKSALTKKLRMANGSWTNVHETLIYLQINNGNEFITIKRSSKNGKTDFISVYENTYIKQALENDTPYHDYYVRLEGAAKRERGFHCYLSNFLKIIQPQVLKYDGKKSPLYLESIFSANYVEQTRGWGGILNVLPSYLGIKELSERILEFTLHLEVQKTKKRKQEILIEKKAAEEEWASLVEKLYIIASNSGGFIQNDTLHSLNKKTYISDKSELTYQNKDAQVSYQDKINELNAKLNQISTQTHLLVDDDKTKALEEDLTKQHAILIKQEKAINLLSSDIAISEDYIHSITIRLNDLKEDLRKYKDLRRLKQIGSDETFNLIHSTCPTCNATIPDSLLLNSNGDETKILSLENNIKYLEKQSEAVTTLLKGEEKSLALKNQKLQAANTYIKDTRSIIREIKNSLTDASSLPSRSDIRKELIIEGQIELLKKALYDEDELKQNLHNTLSSWEKATSELAKLPKDGITPSDFKKLSALEKNFVSHLTNFGYSSTNPYDFKISARSYKPMLNDIDINSEASASDNIRVIWAYMYSILTLDQQPSLTTNHLNILIFDEPRQQEANSNNFASFIKEASKTSSMHKQVIVSTSESYKELQNMTNNLTVNMKHFDSDIVAKIQ